MAFRRITILTDDDCFDVIEIAFGESVEYEIRFGKDLSLFIGKIRVYMGGVRGCDVLEDAVPSVWNVVDECVYVK